MVPFTGLADRTLAEALSEPQVRADDFRIAAITPSPTGFFPPEPAEMCAVASTYVRDDGTINNAYLVFPRTRFSNAEVKEQFVDHYGLIRTIHSALKPIQDAGDHNTELLDRSTETLYEQARIAKLRTVAAFALHIAPGSPNRYHAGLYIPALAHTNVPLENRGALLSALQRHGQTVAETAGGLSEASARFLRAMAQNDPTQANLAYIAAASILPRFEKISGEPIPKPHDPYEGMTRSERRAAQLAERRSRRGKRGNN